MNEAAPSGRSVSDQPVVLVVDDEPDLLELVSLTLSRMNLTTRTASDLNGARRLLKAERFDLCLTDMRLPDGDGLDLVAWIQENRAAVPVAVITAHGNIESAVRALKLGAFDLFPNPSTWACCASWWAARSSCAPEPASARPQPCRVRACSEAPPSWSSCGT